MRPKEGNPTRLVGCWEVSMKAGRGGLLAIVLLLGTWSHYAGGGLVKLDDTRNQTGRLSLLVIGISDYASLPDQCCAITDANALALADKLDTELVELIKAYETSGHQGVQAYSTQHYLALQGSHVPVKIIAVSEQEVDALKQHITRLGGTVDTTFENNLYATLPVPALKPFAMQPTIWRMDLPRPTQRAPPKRPPQ